MTTQQKLYELIDDVQMAMLTTRRADGHLRSRAVATQRSAAGADLWFVTRMGSAKLDEMAHDPHVNLAYFRDRNMEWGSVSGLASITDDRQTIRELYAPDWSMWFGTDDSDPRFGTAEDPRLMLIGVTVHAAEFLAVDEPAPVVLFELAKGWLRGREPEIGEIHRVGRAPRVVS